MCIALSRYAYTLVSLVSLLPGVMHGLGVAVVLSEIGWPWGGCGVVGDRSRNSSRALGTRARTKETHLCLISRNTEGVYLVIAVSRKKYV